MAIGQLVLAWNDLHEKLALLFVAIVSEDARRDIPIERRAEFEAREMERLAGLWSSSAYDRPKRAMLEALLIPLITDGFQRFPTFVEDVNWLLTETDKIEEIRNTAVHAPIKAGEPRGTYMTFEEYWQSFTVAGPNVLMKNRRALKLAGKKSGKAEILREFRWARTACHKLSRYTAAMVDAIADGDVFPWPRRPSLPNRGQKKTPRSRQRPARAK